MTDEEYAAVLAAAMVRTDVYSPEEIAVLADALLTFTHPDTISSGTQNEVIGLMLKVSEAVVEDGDKDAEKVLQALMRHLRLAHSADIQSMEIVLGHTANGTVKMALGTMQYELRLSAELLMGAKIASARVGVSVDDFLSEQLSCIVRIGSGEDT